MDDIVYKYRDWSDDLHKRMLSHNEIFLASPSSLNDPFDSRIPIRFDRGNEEQAFEMALRVVRYENPTLDDSEQRKMAHEIVATEMWKDPQNIERQREYQGHKIDNDFGVCAFSAKRDISLAWTHYAANHFGFCVGFNSKGVIEHFRTNLSSTGLIADFYPVKYVEEFPFIDGFQTPNSENVITVLSTKASSWAYEEEIRLILITGTNQVIALDDTVIQEVILGMRMPDDFKNEITEIAKSKGSRLRLFQAKRTEDNFRIMFEQIDY